MMIPESIKVSKEGYSSIYSEDGTVSRLYSFEDLSADLIAIVTVHRSSEINIVFEIESIEDGSLPRKFTGTNEKFVTVTRLPFEDGLGETSKMYDRATFTEDYNEAVEILSQHLTETDLITVLVSGQI